MSSSSSPWTGRPSSSAARGEVRRQHPLAVVRVDVEAEQQAAQVLQAALDALGRRGRSGLRGQVDRDGPGRGGRRLLGGVVDQRLQAHQRRAGLDLAADRDRALADAGAERRAQHRLHLHALQHQDRRARLDLVADGGRRRDHQRGRGGADDAALVAADAVGDAVDLDQVDRAVGGRHQPEPAAVDQDAAAVLVEPVDLDVGEVGFVAGGDADAEPPLPDARHGHPVAGAAELEVQRTAALVLHLRAPAVGGGQQPPAADLLFVLVSLDRRRGQGDRGVPVADQAALGAYAVDPARVGARVDHLGLVEQVEHEALVGRAALDDHRRVGHRAAQAAQRLLAVAAVGDDLRDHRVEVGGDGVALADAGVDADAGPGGQHQPRDAARGGREVAVGVLGVEPRLDGVTGLGGLGAFELPAVRHVQLQPDQVGAGGDLGDRVLDLQPGVDLEEGEQLVAGVVEELDGAGAAVADGDGEPLGRRLELGGLLRLQDRGRGLLDDLLVAPLHRAVAYAERPRGAVPVGDDLDLDVPGAGDQALQEDDAGAERAQRLLAGAREGVGELLGRGDHPDAAPASARGRLEHQRVADLVAGAQGVVQGGDLAAAPRSDRDADLLGDQLRADLVAELAHRVGVRPDEGDADPLAQLRERRVLGDEAPADPRGVGPGLHQRPLQHGVVEVRPRRGGAQRVGEVRLTDERRVSVGVGVEGDRLDPRPGFRRKIADGMDEPHRGLSTVDDGDTTEHRLSLPITTHRRRRPGLGASPAPFYTLLDYHRVLQCAPWRTPEPVCCGEPTKSDPVG